MQASKKIAGLTIVKYPIWAVPFAFFSMAVFRLPLWLNKKISFWKLMGSGKNGTFDKTPDWRQWALMSVRDPTDPAVDPSKWNGAFIHGYWKFFRCKISVYLLEPIEGHGYWDGKEAFGQLPKQTEHMGQIAVLTRATIRLKKLKNFWAHVDAIAQQMTGAEGFLKSYGIGEVPFIKQATFSIWQSKEHMRDFAYKMKDHAEVVRKTKAEKWYSEDMFVRFKILGLWENGVKHNLGR